MKKYSLFSVYGIEAEYMIVDKQSFKVRPIADKVLQKLNKGKICNEVNLGQVSWSNELVNHVLEIKCAKPVAILHDLDEVFHQSIKKVQGILKEFNCCLMPTSMNPWFIPSSETVLWPHDQREIYHLYNEIFDCKGHGWSNLQSVHINLPYKNEEEFILMHSAIRVVLPLIPYFSASSPFYDGIKQQYADNRLYFYEKNQAKIPSIIGNIIPENVKSIKQYEEILKGIYQDISKYDHAKTLQNPWLNSRAAIPKFDVGAIEIRLMDIQESPYMDIAVVMLIVEIIKFSLGKNLDGFDDSYLRQVYDSAKEFTPNINLEKYFDFFDLSQEDDSFWSLREQLTQKFKPALPERFHHGLNVLGKSGSLSQRLIRSDLSKELYRDMIKCLEENKAYEV